jgi:hypothetical protein
MSVETIYFLGDAFPIHTTIIPIIIVGIQRKKEYIPSLLIKGFKPGPA